jgi:magnesium-transporting ATPase (P-type)
MLRNAGIKIWMLTGDKIETATCIAVSAKLVGKNQALLHTLKEHERARELKNFYYIPKQNKTKQNNSLFLLLLLVLMRSVLSFLFVYDAFCVQTIHTFVVKTKQEAYTHLNVFNSKKDCCLVIDGNSLQLCLDNYKEMFVKVSIHGITQHTDNKINISQHK